MDGLRQHPLRFALTNELHARPFPVVEPPHQMTHLAFLRGEGSGAEDRGHLGLLCRRHGVSPPDASASHFAADFGSFRLKWERHHEFTTYTLFRAGLPAEPFDDVAAKAVPADWLQAIPGDLLVALHLAVKPGLEGGADPAALGRWFVPDSLCGATVGRGAVELWTDFRIHADGATRMLVSGPAIDPRRVGRLVQRLCEIETYRTLALLGLPQARGIAAQVAAIDRQSSVLTTAVAGTAGADEDQALLARLMALAAEIEGIVSSTAYRFSATTAYHALVESRLERLAETPIAGYQTMREFMDRRLVPAMRTCATMQGRLEQMSWRISRCANLLRTRVDIALERQNRDLLASMDRRARLQLRLQETVEGLSVAAISYYVVGLLGYLVKPLDGGSAGTVTAIAVPVVACAAWIVTRRVRAAHRRAGNE